VGDPNVEPAALGRVVGGST